MSKNFKKITNRLGAKLVACTIKRYTGGVMKTSYEQKKDKWSTREMGKGQEQKINRRNKWVTSQMVLL